MSEEKNNGSEAMLAEDTVVENESVNAENSVAAETVAESSDNNANPELQADSSEEKRLSKRLLASVIGGILTVTVLFMVLVFNPFNMQTVEKVQETLHIGSSDEYAKRYIDITGKTVGEVAKDMGMEFKEFLIYYNLPEDMSESVHENAAINHIPVKTYAEKEWGMTLAAAKEMLGWGEDITALTTIGEAINNTTIAKYFGEEQVETVKVLYNLDAAVTGATLYGEVREEIESRMKAEREATEAQVTEDATEEPAAEIEETA